MMHDSLEHAYYEAKGNFNDLFHDLELAQRPNNPIAIVSDSEGQIHLNCLLTFSSHPHSKFSRKHADWAEFQDLFRAMVRRREG